MTKDTDGYLVTKNLKFYLRGGRVIKNTNKSLGPKIY